jgi:cell division protein FtsL
MMRLLSICLVAALVLAAADVYKIKFESTRQSQRLARLRMDIRQEQNAVAALRAQWSKLDSPSRIEELAPHASAAIRSPGQPAATPARSRAGRRI